MEKVKKCARAIVAYMSERSKYGCSDTEPLWHLANTVKNAVDKGIVRLPRPGCSKREEAWELYSEMGAERIAKKLDKLATELAEAILKTPLKEMAALKKYLEEMWLLR